MIELLVVIAIIGILSSVVLASLNDARQKSRDAKRIADIRQLQLAMELYFDANGAYPDTALSQLAPTYIAVVPTGPLASETYYFNPISATDYHLGADLENPNNPALDADVDVADASIITATDDTTGCLLAVTGRHCYDVKP